MANIYFWQRTASPHMVYLAKELAALGYTVTYVINEQISSSRLNMGWEQPSLDSLNLIIASDKSKIVKTVNSLPQGSIHICQGIRANNLVNFAQSQLTKFSYPYWVIIETIEEKPIIGFFKRILYSFLLLRRSSHISGILAIGWSTRSWLINRGFRQEAIFPFAYFIPESTTNTPNLPSSGNTYNIIFVGQLIERKCLHHLIKSLSYCSSQNFKLTIIGDGKLRTSLEQYASVLIPGMVDWLGTIPIKDIPAYLSNSDCLVLPSRHDGWGVVVSEALMSGTPVICSDACGSAQVVRASGFGGVYPVNNIEKLASLLSSMIHAGPLDIDDRRRLKSWSICLGARYGAKYLMSILSDGQSNIPFPPP